jgi:hypothetical protein
VIDREEAVLCGEIQRLYGLFYTCADRPDPLYARDLAPMFFVKLVHSGGRPFLRAFGVFKGCSVEATESLPMPGFGELSQPSPRMCLVVALEVLRDIERTLQRRGHMPLTERL